MISLNNVTAGPETEIPGDLAAAAAQDRQAAADLRERAERDQAEGAQLIATARAEAGRIIGQAESGARVLAESARAAERQAGQLEERATCTTLAAERAAHGEAAVERASALVAERETVTAQLAELTDRLGELGEEAQALAARQAAATQAGDVDAIEALGRRSEAVQSARSALDGQRAAAKGRLAQVGDGTTDHPGELLDVIRSAQAHAAAARKALNTAYPDTPQAKADAAHEELLAVLDGQLERIADEARAEKQPQRQQIVYL